MAEKDWRRSQVMINQAPVLTLWAAVVGAEVLGFEHDQALTLGRAVAGLNTYSKGVSLGLFQPMPREVKEQRRKMRKEENVTVDLLHRAVPAKHTDEGLGGLSLKSPIHAGSFEKYLESNFDDAYKGGSHPPYHALRMNYEESFAKAFQFDKMIPGVLDPEMIRDTGNIVNEVIKCNVRTNLIINNRASGTP